MRPNPRFLNQPNEFWALVRYVSELIGYFEAHSTGQFRSVSIADILDGFTTVAAKLPVKSPPDLCTYPRLQFRPDSRTLVHSGPVSDADLEILRRLDAANRRGWQRAVAALADRSRRHAWLDPQPLGSATAPTELAERVCEYLNYRRQVLPEIERHLMTAAEAKSAYQKLRKELGSTRGPTMDKQTGKKAVPAYLTTMVNMVVDAHAAGIRYDADPQELIKLTHNGQLARVLSRRVDGAFPSVVDPVAIWEIKEYYFTTTFGSRIADGVYETLVDGMELKEARDAMGRPIEHCLIVDAHDTWWSSGGRP